MASIMISNQDSASWTTDRTKWRRRRKYEETAAKKDERQSHARWKTKTREQIYSTKLIRALNKAQINVCSFSAPRRGRAIREAADKALAFTAKGTTRWSRAILGCRIKLKCRKQSSSRHKRAAAFPCGFIRVTERNKRRFGQLTARAKTPPELRRKASVLGRLVPGCRKETVPIILEETADYIAALQMQVRTMTALADLLSGTGAGSNSTGTGI